MAKNSFLKIMEASRGSNDITSVIFMMPGNPELLPYADKEKPYQGLLKNLNVSKTPSFLWYMNFEKKNYPANGAAGLASTIKIKKLYTICLNQIKDIASTLS